MTAWLGVVSAEHVARGVALRIAQIGHGGRAGLARMRAADQLVYYSPTRRLGDGIPLREFTAIGTIADGEIWQADEGGFRPFRRAVDYLPSRSVALDALRKELDLTASPHWGHQLRRGLVRLTDHDAEVIRSAMVLP